MQQQFHHQRLLEEKKKAAHRAQQQQQQQHPAAVAAKEKQLLHRFGSIDKIPPHLLREFGLESDSDDMFAEDEDDDEDDDDEEDMMRLHGDLDDTGSDIGSEYNYDTLKDALGLSVEQVTRSLPLSTRLVGRSVKQTFETRKVACSDAFLDSRHLSCLTHCFLTEDL